jgi:hypothetical protein
MAVSFDGRTDVQRPVATGIPQGSPVSPILFLLYLRPLFDSLQLHHPSIWSLSYIDDVALVAQGKTREGNLRVLVAAARTAFQWVRDKAVAFNGRLQQPAPKPSMFPSDSDSQHSFTYLCEFPESSM